MSTPEDGSDEFDERTISAVPEALADARRRRPALGELDPGGGDDVRVPDDVRDGGKDVDALRVERYIVHLPELAKEGVVEWDEGDTVDGDGTVERGPRFGVIGAAVEAALEDFGGADTNSAER